MYQALREREFWKYWKLVSKAKNENLLCKWPLRIRLYFIRNVCSKSKVKVQHHCLFLSLCNKIIQDLELMIDFIPKADFILDNWYEFCRPCPNCGQTISKLDGCNRVQCIKCGFECCWTCLENWRKHPMCNRFLETASGNAIEVRFIHFYIRYKNHHNSYIIEKAMDFGGAERSRYIQIQPK